LPKNPHGEIVSGHMISRRGFLVGSVTLLAAPLAAEAQQAGKVYRLGILHAGALVPSDPVNLGNSIPKLLRWSSVSCCWGWPFVFEGTRCASPTLR